MHKNDIRKTLKKMRSELDNAISEKLSEDIQKKLISSILFKKSNIIMAYSPIQNEVRTSLVINSAKAWGKVVCLPRIISTGNMEAAEYKGYDLISNSLGIPEPSGIIKPIAPTLIDIILIPGIAFDKKGNRIGFGKGYYDRYLSLLKPGCKKIAFAYDFQLMDEIPSDAHDNRVDMIITENQVISFID